MKKILILGVVLLAVTLGVQTSEASIFSVWADSTGDGLRDLYLGNISGYTGNKWGKANYNFYSDSGHPINGPTPGDFALKIFMYEKTSVDNAWLNLIAGADNAAHGSTWYDVEGVVSITGSSLDPSVALSDDPGELIETSPDLFTGDWSFNKNSDGGVIRNLRGDWFAKIEFGDSDMTTHGFYSADGDVIFTDNLGYNTFFICSSSDACPPIPEPASMMLLGTGLLGLIGFRRKRA